MAANATRVRVVCVALLAIAVVCVPIVEYVIEDGVMKPAKSMSDMMNEPGDVWGLPATKPATEASVGTEVETAEPPPHTTTLESSGTPTDTQPQPQQPQRQSQQEQQVPVAKISLNEEQSRLFSDKFVMLGHSSCRSSTNEITTYLSRTSLDACQSKCEASSSCSAYAVTSGTDTSNVECVMFHTPCDVVADAMHDLYLSREFRKQHDSSQSVKATQQYPSASNSASNSASSTPLPSLDHTAISPSPSPPPSQSPAAPSASPSTAASPLPSVSRGPGDMLSITVVTPTVRRFQHNGDPAPEQYLSPLINKLWNDLTPEQQPFVNILILNADKQPELHTEALSFVNHPGITVLSKPDLMSQIDTSLQSSGALKANGEVFLEDGRQVNHDWIKWVAAEDLDGAYLLEQGAKLSPYVLFLEDDVWPTTNALQKLSRFVQTLQHDDWLFLDLYTPNLAWGPGMLDVTNGERYAFLCCTQAMLFRSDLIPGIISYWRTHPHEPIDDNLRAYRESYTPDRYIYAARPNLFEHVGAYSSNPQKSKGVVEHQSLDFLPLLAQLDEDVEQVPERVVVAGPKRNHQ